MRKFAIALLVFVGAFCGGVCAQIGNTNIIGVALSNVTSILSYVYSGTQGPVNSSIWSSANVSGNATDVYSSPINAIVITGDTINQSGGGSVDGLLIDHFFGGANDHGQRSGLNCRVTQNGATADGAPAVCSFLFAVGVGNVGGTAVAPVGKLFGVNPACIINPNSTFYARCTGGEVNITVPATSSVARKIGWGVVQASGDKTQGSATDTGYMLASQSGAVGWQCGYCFGTDDGFFPVTATGTLIGCWTNGASAPGVPGCGTSLFGIDWTGVTFAAGGAPIAAPLITPTTCKTGSVFWDASFIYVCVATNTLKKATLN